MVVELFGMPRTVYELEVLKYSEYSDTMVGGIKNQPEIEYYIRQY